MHTALTHSIYGVVSWDWSDFFMWKHGERFKKACHIEPYRP